MSSRVIRSKDGRYLGIRHVMYCSETRLYVMFDCHGTTPHRTWAWSGTPAQSRRAREIFDISDKFRLMLDETERDSVL